MTRTQQSIWTPLPNGSTDDRKFLRLSVLVSPRLVTEGGANEPLEEFPDFLDWAQRVSRAKFAVHFAGMTVDAKLEVAPEPAVYARLFDASTVVQSHAFEDKRATAVLTSPSVALGADLALIYGDISAAAHDDLPSRLDWQKAIGELGQTEQLSFDTVLRLLRAERESRERKTTGSALNSSIVGRFAVHDAYNTPLSARVTHGHVKAGPDDPHEAVSWQTYNLVALPAPDRFRDVIDFHRIVGLLSQHSDLLRASGFRVDLIVPRDAFPRTAVDRLTLDVEWAPGGHVLTLPDATPGIQTVLAGAHFIPAPRTPAEPLAIDGFVRLSEHAGLLQVDVNGSVLKVRQFAINIANTEARELERGNRPTSDLDPVGPEPDRTGAPALRSGGLTFADDLRGQALEAAFDRAADLQASLASNSAITLFQDDVVRGLRVDVADGDLPWQSLCRRTSEFHFVGDGSVRTDRDNEGSIRIGGSASADGSLSDILKVDAGIFSWSGWSLVASRPGRAIDPTDAVGDAESLAPPGLPIEVEHKPRGQSLPSLRFGRRYRVRMRIVDLAGNARPWDPNAKAPIGTETAATVYHRFEPIEPPTVALVGPTTMTPPTDGENLAVIAIRSFNAAVPDNRRPTAEQSERHLVPPAGSQRMAELHGMLDVHGKLDPASYKLLCTRDGDLKALAGDSSEAKMPVAEVGFELPFLPDPLSTACVVRLAGYGNSPPLEARVPLYRPGASWPDASAFRVQLSEGPNDVAFDAANRVLRVSLGKGEHVRLRVSHELRDEDLPLMGVLEWGLERAVPAMQEQLRKRARAGRDWMLTPWRELDLVHAVQKPLVKPVLEKLSIQRALGATRATVSFATPVDTLSTEKLDLSGTWLDPRDTLDQPAPEWIVGGAHAAELKLARLSSPGFDPPGRQDFGQHPVGHVFADTRYRRVGYALTATTRFTRFMPAPLRDPAAAKDLSVISDDAIGFVPNSAPPPAPDVVYVIPTFGWTRHSDGTEKSSYRDGGGLRVYLRRPWLVTGAMEMLAVVLPPAEASEADVDSRLNKFVTRWGSDPTLSGGGLPHGSPSRSQFNFAVSAGPIDPARLDPIFPVSEGQLPTGPFAVTNLPLPGAPTDTRVEVAPHLVGYDPERQLWFADIVIDPGAHYLPFTRLALARYQPISATGAHLSSVVQTEVLQLTNDRLATVTQGDALNYRVRLFGEAIATGAAAHRLGTVELTVEHLAPGADEDLDWQVLEGVTIRDPAPTITVNPKPVGAVGAIKERAGTAANLAVAANARSLVLERDFATLLKDRPAILALAMPDLADKEVVLPRAPGLGERFRLVLAEHEPRPMASSGAIGEGGVAAPRVVYLEMFGLGD